MRIKIKTLTVELMMFRVVEEELVRTNAEQVSISNHWMQLRGLKEQF